MKYFEMRDDVEAAERWWLKPPIDAEERAVDPDLFTVARPLDLSEPLKVPLRREGKELDFTFGAFDMPVVNRRTLHVLEEFASGRFQRFLTIVDGRDEEYFAINFLDIQDCIDEGKSEFIKWKEGDSRQDKIGEYRQMTKLQIDEARTGNCEVFRLWGWKVTIIVSERLRRAFVDNAISGVRFRPVN